MEFAMRRLGISWEDAENLFRRLDPRWRLVAIFYFGLALWGLYDAAEATTEISMICNLIFALGSLAISYQSYQMALNGFSFYRMSLFFGFYFLILTFVAVDQFAKGSYISAVIVGVVAALFANACLTFYHRR